MMKPDRKRKDGKRDGGHLLPLFIVLTTLAACSQDRVKDGVAAADGWLGKWNGPEATYLDISGGKGVYQITIKNLDAARTFDASATNEGITFQRDGVKEVIRATNGQETGMKWLADKQHCLTVKPGEGYCRE